MNSLQSTVLRRAGRLAAFSLAAFSLAAAIMASGAVFAGEINEVNGVAIKGYDPVAYFTDGKPVQGKAEYNSHYKDGTFRFASAEHKKLFDSNPDKYAPQYGGFCAYGTATGHKADVDPAAFSVVDDKLYLNYNKSVQGKWKQDVPGYIVQANQQWPSVSKSTDVAR